MAPPVHVQVTTPTLKVLYVFAGLKRKADMKHFLTKYCKQYGGVLKMMELDILRSRKHDLTSRARKAHYLNKVRGRGL